MTIQVSVRAVALTISLAIHAILVLLLVLNKLTGNRQAPLFGAHAEPQVIMLPSHGLQTQTTAKRTRMQQAPQRQSPQTTSTPTYEKISPFARPVLTEDEETSPTKSTPAPLGTEKGTGKTPDSQVPVKPHSFARARSSWANSETTSENVQQEVNAQKTQETNNGYSARQTAYTEKNGIASSFGKALAYQPHFETFSNADASAAHGDEHGLTTVVNQEFTVFKTKQYLQFVAYSIGYELNKQQIHEAPCNVPRRLVVQINLASSGKLLDSQILSSDGLPDFNQAVLRAITEAAPFRSFPTSMKEPNFIFTFVISPDPSILAQPDSHARGPISFFVSNPYQS